MCLLVVILFLLQANPGMVWRSHLAHDGWRRANYYIKHLIVTWRPADLWSKDWVSHEDSNLSPLHYNHLPRRLVTLEKRWFLNVRESYTQDGRNIQLKDLQYIAQLPESILNPGYSKICEICAPISATEKNWILLLFSYQVGFCMFLL